MSLTSRVSNLFSSGSTNPSTQRDNNIIALGEDGLPGGRNNITDISLSHAIGSKTMAQETIEEEDRPPYLHVSPAALSKSHIAY